MIETKKLTDSTLKRITKSNNNYEDVHITDVPSNVISDGTSITDQVLANINYKDDNSLEFSKLSTNTLPTPPSGKCIIYSTSNGKLYCAINGYNPFEISAVTASDIIKKKGTTYVNNGALEYFNLNNEMKLFSNSTKLGATPTRASETNVITDAAYFDITSEEIKAIINGNTKLRINSNIFNIQQNNSEIGIDLSGDICVSHNNDSKLDLKNERFVLTGKQTELGIDSTKTELKCYTNLTKSTYGNSNFRLEFDSSINVKKLSNNSSIISINSNGEISIGTETLEKYIRRIASEEYRRNKTLKLVSNERTTCIAAYVLTDENYVFYISDTYNSDVIVSFEINGLDIANTENNPIYIAKTNSYYYLHQEAATYIDGDDTDYLYVYKKVGNTSTPVYFREVYEECNEN